MCTAAALLLLSTLGAGAESVPTGTGERGALAAPCSGCHAPNGLLPTLSARTASELRETLLAFRSGARQGTVMTRIARGYTREELTRIALELGRPDS